MKPLALVLTILLAAFSAAGAAVIAVRLTAPGGAELAQAAATPLPAVPPATGNPAEAEELRVELRMLAQRVIDLERELSLLHDERARRPVPPPAELAPAPPTGDRQAEFSDEERAAILRILENAREEERALREEERLQREEDLILARAEHIANEIGLSAADQKALTDHMLVAAVKRRELLDAARDSDFDRELMRDRFLELRDWNERSLIETFGPDLAAQIQSVERSSRGGDRTFGREAGDPDPRRPTGRERSAGGRGGRGSG